MPYQPSETLKSRTFIGLLLAQFTATFNDQAIHIVAIFYASDMLVRYVGLRYIDEKAVVAIVTACFITPFLLFSPYAGVLADKFSKRSIVVFWKVAEVGMMSLALFGLCLPHLAAHGWGNPHTLAVWSAVLVVSTVLMMGTHSTFFVPAKYGAMPEILHPTVLSRGNGLLEGTSFMAQIFGTSAGGILYALLKSRIVGGKLEPGKEWVIGLLLLVLALLGTCTSILMERIPVAAPHRKLTWSWWKPLHENLSILWRSKPLMLSVLGIAFAAFMTLFLRQTLLYEGELAKEIHTARVAQAELHPELEPPQFHRHNFYSKLIPVALESASQQSELRVALLIALIGFGVGIGSLIAGFLSGQRVELGLVPLGAFLMFLITVCLAIWMNHPALVVTCLFLVGGAAGLYIVPLYTLLQHRAPKESKGNVIAASNFLNVVGGMIAVGLFYFFTFALEAMFGSHLQPADVYTHPEKLPEFIEGLRAEKRIPQTLFLILGFCTIALIFLLYRRLPDLFVRGAIWFRSLGHKRLQVFGAENLPSDGPVILATNSSHFEESIGVYAATDRFTRMILIESAAETAHTRAPVLRFLTRMTGLVSLRSESASEADCDQALRAGLETLREGDIVAISLHETPGSSTMASLVQKLQAAVPAMILPVRCTAAGEDHVATVHGESLDAPHVIIGPPLPGGATIEDARFAINQLVPQPYHG